MRRRLFQSMVVLSSLLFLANTALWIRSYATGFDIVGLFIHSTDADGVHGQTTLTLTYLNGKWTFCRSTDAVPESARPPIKTKYTWRSGFGVFAEAVFSHQDLEGFNNGFHNADEVLPTWPERLVQTSRSFDVPMFVPTAVTALLPLFVMTRWMSGRRRHQAGRCLTCGYDLRATPDRCPECGTVPTHPTPTHA